VRKALPRSRKALCSFSCFDMHIVAWLFSLVTGSWFGLVASKSGRNWLAWAGGGAIFALIISTIILGLGRATLIPVRTNAYAWMLLKCIAASAVVIGVSGWLMLRTLRSEK
jgi:hypothetical protein